MIKKLKKRQYQRNLLFFAHLKNNRIMYVSFRKDFYFCLFFKSSKKKVIGVMLAWWKWICPTTFRLVRNSMCSMNVNFSPSHVQNKYSLQIEKKALHLYKATKKYFFVFFFINVIRHKQKARLVFNSKPNIETILNTTIKKPNSIIICNKN